MDGVEFDVRRTADWFLVVHHDATVQEMIISESPRRDLPDYLPTLDEAIRACRGVEVNIEIKNYRHDSEPTYDETGRFALEVATFVSEHDLVNSTIISCFDLDTCVRVRDLNADLRVGWLLWNQPLANSIARARELKLTSVHPVTSAVNRSGVDAAHAAGIAIYAWTAREPADVDALARWNVDGLITDDPTGALTVLGRSSTDGAGDRPRRTDS